jgi:two-component system, cell cycle sensor histidine kinase and response regulator CckA
MKAFGATKRQKILIVGSEPAVLVSLRTLLTVRALHVLATDQPEVAIHLAETTHAEIALALIDVCTVNMEPRELAERLRAERPGLKTLFFSSLVDGEVIRLGIVDPDGGVLRKDGVVKAIEEALAEPVKPAHRPRTLAAGAAFHYSMV